MHMSMYFDEIQLRIWYLLTMVFVSNVVYIWCALFALGHNQLDHYGEKNIDLEE